MEAETTLVWAQSGVELNSISTIDLDLVLVVFPHHAELNDSFGDGHHVESGPVFGVLFKEGGAFKSVHELCSRQDIVSPVLGEQLRIRRMD